MNIAELVTQLRTEEDEWRERAQEYANIMRQAEAEAGMRSEIIDRILATDEARVVNVTPPSVTFTKGGGLSVKGGGTFETRDIQALVESCLVKDPHLRTLTKNELVSTLSRNLKCRRGQIEASLRALDGAGAP